MLLNLSKPISNEKLVRLRKLPNSSTYIRPDMTAEFSHFALLLDLNSKELIQMSFSDRSRFKKFFKGNTKSITANSYGYRCIIPRPHLTLRKSTWTTNMEDIFENLDIITPCYDADPFPLLKHPQQRIPDDYSTNTDRVVFIETTIIGPKSPVTVNIVNLNFTKALRHNCAGIECVTKKSYLIFINLGQKFNQSHSN